MYSSVKTNRPDGALASFMPPHEDFPGIQSLLSGGWGYEQADAIIVNNPKSGTEEMFDGMRLQTLATSLRNNLEFAAPQNEVRYFPLMHNRASQELVKGENGRYFDHLTLDVLLAREEDAAMIMQCFTAENRPVSDVLSELKDKVLLVQREFWFDVTSFLEHNWALTVKREQAELAEARKKAEEQSENEDAPEAAGEDREEHIQQ